MCTLQGCSDNVKAFKSLPGSCLTTLSRHIRTCMGRCQQSAETSSSSSTEPTGPAARWKCCLILREKLRGREGKGCREKCLGWKSALTKTFLIIVNLSFLVAGLSVVVLGIWLHVYQDSYIYTYLLRDNPVNPVLVFERIPLLLIIIGFLLAGVSFLGCCGACADSVCFLSFYTLLLVGVILCEMVLGIVFMSSKDELSIQLSRSMTYQVWHEYNKTALPGNITALNVYCMTLAWDTLQNRGDCCGSQGPQDYLYSSWYNHSKDTGGNWVPRSCCRLSEPDPDNMVRQAIVDENYCQVEALIHIHPKSNNDTFLYLKTQGCHKVVLSWLYDYEDRICFLIALLVLIQVVSLVLGCVLMTWVRKKATDYWFCEEEEYEQ